MDEYYIFIFTLQNIMTIAKIIIPRIKLFPLDYIVTGDIKIGQLVIVNFRDEDIVGIVYAINVESKLKNLKPIIKSFEPKVFLDEATMLFFQKAAEYYMVEIGSIAKLALPINLSSGPIKPIIQEFDSLKLHTLSLSQQDALDKIQQYGVSVLHGVTGSGKTEIYFHLMEKYIKQGKQVLFLLPEIALSKQIISRFEERFNTKAVIWNSSVTPAQKKHILRSIISGSVKLIIGARSALFLPYKNLGCIIVDEEHDTSYKQEDNILYNARDMSVLRGHLSNIPIILGSATPSLETYYNIKNGKYQHIRLESRFGEAKLPNVIPIDMRGRREKSKFISEKLKDAIRHTIDKKQQVMLFLNRKGYAPLLVCGTCGYTPCCESCAASLVFHKGLNKLICHHCGFHIKSLLNCPECKSEDSMNPCGPGVERIYEEVAEYFPEANIQLMTKDEMNSNKKSHEILDNIMSGEINIIIGTQIITKGYHFPNLTTVGVIDTDVGFASSGNLRALEHSFHLLYQLGGRAGRETIQGNIYLQTFQPDSNFIKLLGAHDYDGFMEYELSLRKIANMPPISKIATLLISDKNEATAKQIAIKIINSMPLTNHITALGPVPALISKVKNQYRYRILLIAKKNQNLQLYIRQAFSSLDKKISGNIKIDIDPYNFS
jgi:primosomal protein N' (replication factor Y)